MPRGTILQRPAAVKWFTLLFVIPAVTAFVGWVMNWLAVRMIFWPERFIGVGQAVVLRYL
jgi:uncharacterized membrane protein YheB (UPF0754 family)